MAAGIKDLAQNLQSMGRNGDTILAHIMPEEAAMLKRMGGSGTINPKTGLPEFYFGDISSYGGSSPGYSAGGGQDSPSESGPGPGAGGGSSWSGGGNTWSGDGGRDSSSSNQSPNYNTGGDGFNSSNWGVGGGMLTPSNPSVSSSGGSAWTPTGGGGGGFGVPTIISNAASTAGQMLAPIGQGLLNFSDTSSALLGDIYRNPSNYVPSFGNARQAGYYGDIPSAVGELPGTMDAFGRVMNPRTIPVPGYMDYANAVGDINFLTQGPQEPTRILNEKQITVPDAPTSTTNAYDFAPNYEGLAEEGIILENRIQNTRLLEEMNRAFPIGPQPRQLPSFPAVPDAGELYGVDPSAGISSLRPPVDIRPTTSLLADRQPNAPAVEQPSEVGASVTNTLDTYFDELSRAQTGQPPRQTYLSELSQAQTGQAPPPSVLGPGQFEAPQRGVMTYPGVSEATPSVIDYSRVQPTAPVPLYAEATPFSGPKGALPMTNQARYAGGGVFSDIEELNNLPSGYLGKLYGIESTFGKNLTTPLSSAAGPFQFTKSTARAYGLMGKGFDDRMDLLQSAAATGSLAADNAMVLENALGRPPSAGELYLAHQQGAGGAVSLLRNPGSSAFNALKRAYGGDEDMAMQALVNNRGSLSMSAADFAKMWTSKMDRAPVAPPGGYDTQFASAPPSPPVTPAQVAQQPALTGNLLDAEFMRVVDEIGRSDLPDRSAVDVSQNVFENERPQSTGGDGGRPAYSPPRDVVEGDVTEPPVTPVRTGMNLNRQAYVPRGFATTTSPVY